MQKDPKWEESLCHKFLHSCNHEYYVSSFSSPHYLLRQISLYSLSSPLRLLCKRESNKNNGKTLFSIFEQLHVYFSVFSEIIHVIIIIVTASHLKWSRVDFTSFKNLHVYCIIIPCTDRNVYTIIHVSQVCNYSYVEPEPS